MDLDELQRQHEELQRLAGQLAHAVADDRSPQSTGALRWQFARVLMQHLALEDRHFYPDIQRMPDEQLRTTAQRLQTEMGPLAGAFSAYMTRWNDDQVSRDWTGFCRETRDILKTLISRIDKEERLLLPLLERNNLLPPAVRRSA